MLSQVVEASMHLLNNYSGAQNCREYLDGRLNKNLQQKFQFGYFPDNNDLPALLSLIDENELINDKLLSCRQIYDTISPRKIYWNYFEHHPLIMPYYNQYGKVVALVGRTLTDETKMKELKISKYKNTTESSEFKKGHLLYGLFENKQKILEKDYVYIVEGQFDVIKSQEIQLNNIVALGNNNMTAYQFSVINRYTNNIRLLLDNDQAGEKGRKKIISKFGNSANITNYYVPKNYKDVDELIKNNPKIIYSDGLFEMES